MSTESVPASLDHEILDRLMEFAESIQIGSGRTLSTSARSHVDKQFAVGMGETSHVSIWSTSPAKRSFDLVCVVPALLFLSPVVLAISIAVRITSDGPVFFRQERAGLKRKAFTIYKFRTMFNRIEGPSVTKAEDPRLTRLGRFLRKHKLDEIPQLYNVLRGDMSLVGPRPKLSQFEHLEMECRPGITGAATLAFAKEEGLLKNVPLDQLDQFHIEVLSPIKKSLDQEYQRRATFFSDLDILFGTVFRCSGFSHLELVTQETHTH